MPNSSLSSLIGTVIDGRYRVDRIVGEGGYGVVFRAWHLRFQAPIALKVLKLPDQLPDDVRDAFIQSFESEGRVLFELSGLHPSIVRAMETGVVLTADGASFPYLVLEWLHGASLDKELKARRAEGLPPFDLQQSLALLDKPAEAVATAHRRNVAHRDIKPANIFLCWRDDETVPKVLDFGLAKVMHDLSSTTAMFNASIGGTRSFTPAYGAPEQWLQRLGATGPWTDVYALALVCVELVSGRPALVGSDSAQLMAACLDETFRPTPRALGIEVPAGVEEVLLRALAISPRDRFANVSVFWSALCDAANHEAWCGIPMPRMVIRASDDAPQSLSVPSASARPVEPTQPTSLTASVARGVSSELSPPSPRKRWVMGLGLVLAVLAGMGVLALTRSQGQQVHHPDPVGESSVVPPEPSSSASTASMVPSVTPPPASSAPPKLTKPPRATPTRPPSATASSVPPPNYDDHDLNGLIRDNSLEKRE